MVSSNHRHLAPPCHASWQPAEAAANATRRNAAGPLIATAAADSAVEPAESKGCCAQLLISFWMGALPVFGDTPHFTSTPSWYPELELVETVVSWWQVFDLCWWPFHL